MRFVAGRLCLDEQITTMLGQSRGGGGEVGREGQADADECSDGGRGSGGAGRVVVGRKIVHGVLAGGEVWRVADGGRSPFATAKMYASRVFDESGVAQVTLEAVHAQREVWLRGNIRPGVAGVVIVSVAGAAAMAVAAVCGLSLWIVGAILAVTVFVVANVAIATWVVSRPRLTRAGLFLEVRLAPGQFQRVPLEVIECIFRGSDAIVRPGEETDAARFRVGTLVVRLAERATQWHHRYTFRPWGTWEDGHIVIDGRWCEPLSIDTVRAVATRLLEAKREVAAGEGR